jgi:F-type H+-transporting ATPase subunit a
LAGESSESFDLLHHLESITLYKLNVGGLDLTITNSVATMFISAGLVAALLLMVARNPKLVPGRLQNIVESIVQFIRNDIVLSTIGKDGMVWFPFLATIFFFILFNNLLGLVPLAGAPTSKLAVPLTLAVIVFFSVHIYGVMRHGPLKYVASWVPSGLPMWVVPIVFLLEAISTIAKPFSLTVRLFASMLAGHILVLVFVSFGLMMGTLAVMPLAIPFAIAILTLKVLLAAIQAYVFTILSAMYISAASHAEH